MINPVNLLVLDEPTNHLDLASCDVLEDALDAYPGTIVLVTHDRYLIREVATSLVAVRDGRAQLHAGVDEAILSPHAAPPAPAPTPAAPAGRATKPGQVRSVQKRSAAEVRQARAAAKGLKRKVERLERRAAAETTVADLQRQLAEPEIYEDHEKVRLLVAAHDGRTKARCVAVDQWLEAQGLDRAEALLTPPRRRGGRRRPGARSRRPSRRRAAEALWGHEGVRCPRAP
jgi:ATP-binding cassette subfamily F protein 3